MLRLYFVWGSLKNLSPLNGDLQQVSQQGTANKTKNCLLMTQHNSENTYCLCSFPYIKVLFFQKNTKLQRNLPLVNITYLIVIHFGYKAAWGNCSSDEGSKMLRLLPASSSTMLEDAYPSLTCRLRMPRCGITPSSLCQCCPSHLALPTLWMWRTLKCLQPPVLQVTPAKPWALFRVQLLDTSTVILFTTASSRSGRSNCKRPEVEDAVVKDSEGQ